MGIATDQEIGLRGTCHQIDSGGDPQGRIVRQVNKGQFLREAPDNGACPVDAAAIDHDNFQIRHAHRRQGPQNGFDRGGFIQGRNGNRHARQRQNGP